MYPEAYHLAKILSPNSVTLVQFLTVASASNTSLSTTMLRAPPGFIPNFKKEGKGGVYIVARCRRCKRHRSGRRNPLAQLRTLEVKVGHTNWLPRRVRQYRGCASDKQDILWYGYFHAQKRMHLERRVHLALERRGIHPKRGVCAGDDCSLDHKEVFPMLLVRRLSRLKQIIREKMGFTGEADLKFYKIKDWPTS
ncbi:hypothetical protein C8R43DRAFT_947817 [Mycena crocata]|nr:hypothetical protein C8R43DRAFT_947817 [Mycena crocata]